MKLIRSENTAVAQNVQRTVDRQAKEQVLRLAVRVIFEYWRDRMGKDARRTLLDDKRTARILARLRENDGDVSELLHVIDGALKDSWLMGTEANCQRRYDGLETIFRDRSQVERLYGLVRNPEDRHPYLVETHGA